MPRCERSSAVRPQHFSNTASAKEAPAESVRLILSSSRHSASRYEIQGGEAAGRNGPTLAAAVTCARDSRFIRLQAGCSRPELTARYSRLDESSMPNQDELRVRVRRGNYSRRRSRTSRTMPGRLLMIAETPSEAHRCTSAGVSTVHTCTKFPCSFARAT